MPRTRRLLREGITYFAAKERESVVAYHLGLSARSVNLLRVGEVENWFHGVCISVNVEDKAWRRVLLRLPLPYRNGEAFRPGNCDEKVRCEAGTYAWLRENCPDVPIPHLYGFAMSTGETSNILVDKDWHIKCLIDLEWACSHPIEMVAPPCWLSGKQMVEIDPESSSYNEPRKEFMGKEFMDILAAKEKEAIRNIMPRLSDVMNAPGTLANFDGPLVAHRKVSEKENLDTQLQQAFEDFEDGK
ncbi:hypothetical protein FQN53_007445 [Emmonsiellopsis sp. PD_33]|nr:hypothetical protein FQN53_007445 [Emmonsiellopsis sp. PD_33]